MRTQLRFLGLSVAIAAVSVLFAARLQALTFTVTNTNDAGAGSLREAINQANTNPGLDEIHFNIPGGGVRTIAPASNLPTISDPAIIDGYTQPGASVNTAPVGTNANLLIELDGSGVVFGVALTVDSASTVRGLVLNRWSQGVSAGQSATLVVRGNFIGTDPTGTIARPNGTGISPTGHGTIMGGASPADRNLISGNSFAIYTLGNGSQIQGNLIGTDASGLLAIPNTQAAIVCANFNGAGTTIGGAGPGEGNVISGNVQGIWLSQGGTVNVVRGNRIGVNAAGTGPLPNGVGLFTSTGGNDSIIGGIAPGEANEIAYNLSDGVQINGGGLDNAIRGNSIHDNGNLGIDLTNDGPSFNDALDADGGPNNMQNFPIVKLVEHLGPEGADSTRIVGKINSAPSTTFDLDFYSNPACTNFPREFIEGEAWFGTSQVTTDVNGNANFDETFPVFTEPGARISVTATDPNGNTSEFSQRILFSIFPTSGPPAGGTSIGASGTDFADPTGISFGATPATGITFGNDHQLSFTSPALPPGTVHDVIATTPDGTTGTLVKGWVSDFLDVDATHPFYSFVTRLVSNALTAGVGGGNFGVDQPTLREQMAVFLLLAKNGLCFVPPNCTNVFTDVPCSSPYARFIEGLAAAGVTAGCGGGNYCPTNAVTREQMAVFLLVTQEGAGYQPPACVTPTFGDVPCSSGFAIWIEELVRRGITAGCGGGNFCPTFAVTRGQMAVFISVTFQLP